MPDWLKFLGKLYTREHGPGGSAQGCFIALNGVNGNVWGHFRSLSVTERELQIIAGDDLIKVVAKTTDIMPAEKVINKVAQMTSKASINTELLYYRQSWYWLVEFGNEITVLGSNGMFLGLTEAEELCDLIKANIGLTN